MGGCIATSIAQYIQELKTTTTSQEESKESINNDPKTAQLI